MMKLPQNGKSFDILEHISAWTLIMFLRISGGYGNDKVLRNKYIYGYHKYLNLEV